MILSIRIADDLYQHYAGRNPQKPQVELEKALEAFKELDPREARVVVAGEELKELSKLLGHPVSSSKELLEHVVRAGRVSLPEEGVELFLEPALRARLKAQADFMNKSGKATPEEYRDFVKAQITSRLFAL